MSYHALGVYRTVPYSWAGITN